MGHQEIDTPGHTAIIGESHPDLIACFHADPWSSFANGTAFIFFPSKEQRIYFCEIEPPAGQLRFVDPAVISFTQKLFKSVASQLPSKLFSTGGDEINANCYAQDAKTQQLLNSTKQTFEQALDKFTQETHATLIDLGKTPVVWEGWQ